MLLGLLSLFPVDTVAVWNPRTSANYSSYQRKFKTRYQWKARRLSLITALFFGAIPEFRANAKVSEKSKGYQAVSRVTYSPPWRLNQFVLGTLIFLILLMFTLLSSHSLFRFFHDFFQLFPIARRFHRVLNRNPPI